MHQPSGGIRGQASDIAIQAEQLIYIKRLMAERIAHHTGQTVEQIQLDSERDRWFTAEQAKDYGLIDHVIVKRGEMSLSPVAAGSLSQRQQRLGGDVRSGTSNSSATSVGGDRLHLGARSTSATQLAGRARAAGPSRAGRSPPRAASCAAVAAG